MLLPHPRFKLRSPKLCKSPFFAQRYVSLNKSQSCLQILQHFLLKTVVPYIVNEKISTSSDLWAANPRNCNKRANFHNTYSQVKIKIFKRKKKPAKSDKWIWTINVKQQSANKSRRFDPSLMLNFIAHRLDYFINLHKSVVKKSATPTRSSLETKTHPNDRKWHQRSVILRYEHYNFIN